MGKRNAMKSRFLSIMLVFTMVFSLFGQMVSAEAVTEMVTGGVSISTTLTDGVILKGSKKTFDVIARDADGKKIPSEVTLNGEPVKYNWDDQVKTSYTLTFTQEGENSIVVSAGGISQTYKIIYEKAAPGDIIGYSTWSIEALTIGRGFIEIPMQVPIYEGENTAVMLDRLLTEHGYSYSRTGELEGGFYLAILGDGGAKSSYNDSSFKYGCQDPEIGAKINTPFNPTDQVPQALISVLDKEGVSLEDAMYVDDNSKPFGLGEFDYTWMSGWMYAINSVFPNVGFSDSYLSDGDVVRVQFTLYGYGADIGGGYSMGGDNSDFYPIANKDKLMTEIARVNSAEDKEVILSNDDIKQAYEKAIAVAEKLDANQEEVDNAYTELSNILNAIPEEPKYPFFKLTTADDSTQLRDIKESQITIDPWEDGSDITIPMYMVTVPEGTEFVNIYYSSDSDISDKCAWYDQATNKYPFQEDGEYTLNKMPDGSYKLSIKVDKTGDGNPDTFIMEDNSYNFVNAVSFNYESSPEVVFVDGVSINESNVEIKNSKQLQLEAKISPENATNKNVRWKSSDINIASVDSNGLITAKEIGSATITATTIDGGYMAECIVNIIPNDSDTVEVSINTTPEDAIVFMTDSSSNRILPLENGKYSLKKGDTYSYLITKNGYVSKVGDFIAGEEIINVELEKAIDNEAIKPDMPSYWPSFRGNSNNNAVVNAPTPKTADETTLYWATKVGDGWGSNAIGSPIIVDDYLVFCSGTSVYKMNRFTGEVMEQKGEMVAKSNFNIIPPTYAEGMIFVGLANGTIQAFNADTLESLWVYKDPLKGQPNSPIIYNDGYVYTGFWRSEVSNTNYVCVSITDEKIDDTVEEKLATWRYTQKGGFYWSGAYVCDEFLLVGTDDGVSGYLSDTSNLLSLNPKTGELLGKIENLNGDIRSSVSYDEVTDRYYFASKGGSFYSVAVNEDGTFKKDDLGVQGYDLKEILLNNGANEPELPPMSTSTPVVYNGRAYIGVAGTSQFGQYSGHNITVLDLTTWEIAYTVPTKGYPQTSGLLSTAYEDEEGYVYVYFIDNYTPGQVRVIKDKPGVTSVVDGVTEKYINNGKVEILNGCAPVLFTPSGKQAQYAICSPIVDEEGTLYFKNDSANMMALGSKIKNIVVTNEPNKNTFVEGETFDPAGMKVTAYLTNGVERDITSYVSFSKDPLTTADTEITIYYNYVMYGDKFDAENGNETNVTVTPLETYIDLRILSASDKGTITYVEEQIDAIGDVTLDSGNSINLARSAYDALEDSLKEYVANYNLLTEAEAEYKTINEVASKIKEIGQFSYDKKDVIKSAREAYEALTDEQKEKIINYQVLVEAENTMTSLIDEINAVQQLIEDLGKVTLKSEDAIVKARAAYDLLPKESKVGVENYNTLVDAEKTLSELKKEEENTINTVVSKIDAIGQVSYSKKDVIKSAREAYDALTDEQKVKIGNYQVLVEAENTMTSLIEEINAVKQLIENIGTVTLDSEAKIAEARAAYDALPEESKAGLENYNILVAAENSLEELKKPEIPEEEVPEDKPSTEGGQGNVPLTWDYSNLIYFIITFILSGGCIVVLMSRSKRKMFKKN